MKSIFSAIRELIWIGLVLFSFGAIWAAKEIVRRGVKEAREE